MARIEHMPYAIEDEAPLWFDGAAAGGRGGAGRNNIYGTAGDDRLHGTSGGDNFHVDQGGDDTLHGGAGNDKFFFGNTYTDKDVVYGGDGLDRLILSGTSDTNLVLGPDNFRDIESIKLTGGSYDFTFLDGISDLRVFVSNGSANLSVDAAEITGANIRIIAGLRDDILIGGNGNDVLIGSFGADTLTGGLGNDVFKYRSIFDSTDSLVGVPDLITDFTIGDRISLPIKESGVDDYHTGTTPKHIGDVTVTYDSSSNISHINVFTNTDDVPDMTILAVGDLSGIYVIHHSDIVI